jgi:voltage-gated potassium channel
VDERTARWERRFNVPVIVAALATIPLLVLEQGNPGEPLRNILQVCDWIVWGIFALELAVMLAIAPSRKGYIRAHPLDVAVVVLTPPFLSLALQSIRVLRVLRLLRLLRVGPLVRRLFTLDGIRYAAVLSGVVLIGGAEAFAAAENVSIGTGIYWALQTMTTVGYGDVHPTTSLGRVIASVLMVFGIGFFALVTGAIAQRFLSTEIEEAAEEVEASEAEILAQIGALGRQLQTLEATVRSRAQTRSSD